MSSKLLDAIYNTLKNDAEYMAMLGLTPSSPGSEITKRIIRGMEPDSAISGSNVPLVLIYTKPGRFGRNFLVYEGKFCIDHYAKTSYQARQLAERAYELFHNKTIESGDFKSFTSYLAYDSDFATGITGVKGFESIYDVDYVRAN